MTTRGHVVDMANQIAANFATMGPEAAARATAAHIADFWTLRMRALLADEAGAGACDLSPVAREAARLIAEGADARP